MAIWVHASTGLPFFSAGLNLKSLAAFIAVTLKFSSLDVAIGRTSSTAPASLTRTQKVGAVGGAPGPCHAIAGAAGGVGRVSQHA